MHLQIFSHDDDDRNYCIKVRLRANGQDSETYWSCVSSVVSERRWRRQLGDTGALPPRSACKNGSKILFLLCNFYVFIINSQRKWTAVGKWNGFEFLWWWVMYCTSWTVGIRGVLLACQISMDCRERCQIYFYFPFANWAEGISDWVA